MGILRQSAKLRSQMVSGPPCMIHNDRNSFEFHILQSIHCPASRNSYFLAKFLLFPTFCFYSYFLTKFLLLQRFTTKTTILLNVDLNSAQILRIYLSNCLLLFELNPLFSLTFFTDSYQSYFLPVLLTGQCRILGSSAT